MRVILCAAALLGVLLPLARPIGAAFVPVSPSDVLGSNLVIDPTRLVLSDTVAVCPWAAPWHAIGYKLRQSGYVQWGVPCVRAG